MAGPLTRLRALTAPLLPDRRPRRPRLSEGSVARQVFVLQVAVVLLLVLAAVAALVLQVRRDSTQAAGDRSLAVAETLANSPATLAGLRSPDPTARLQGPAEAARKRTGVDFVVVMNTRGIRYTHPIRNRIGKKFVGTIEPARQGRVHRETVEGTIGRIVQVVVPVKNSDGRVVGLVSAGIKVDKVGRVVDRQLPLLFGAAAVALALALGGTALVSRRLRRQTHGLGTREMTRMYEHHDAVLHAVHEGVLIVSGEGRLLLANDEASRLLDLPSDAQGRHVGELGLEAPMSGLFSPGRVATDEVLRSGDRLLAVNNRSTDRHGGPPGWVATIRDTTELRLLSTRVETARKRLELLYEASGGIGTTLDVTRTAEELAQVPVPRFADFVTVDLAEPVLSGDEPGPDAIEPVMRRTAVHGVRDDQPLYPPGELITFAPPSPQVRAFESGQAVTVPRLSESEGWRAQDPERTGRVLEYGIHSLIAAPLRARGVLLGVVNFWRSERPEPFEDDDVSLASELAARAAVSIDNARRYTREHGMAVALQRSLLPRALPEQSAVEVASRYLPAQAGVGGDWFDVIPLPGARVALAVGDVVGHGLHAAATMGRLRTAVHNFSALDLPPDELLSHLDELASRVDQDAIEAGDETAITGATCLYAVYDPASRTCVIARAGHPTPALARPDGTVEFPDVPSGLPLGIGGLPFESLELKLEEGSRLVLYTDGLVERRDQDIDAGLRLLREAVAHAGQSPEESCDAVLDALLPPRQGDDIALLVARTQVLSADRVAEWDVASDPSAVSGVRAAVNSQLAEWGLEEQGYVTELILSELITNAIRHAAGPIRVRLLRDRSLICEVADHSSTSPHLRHAATTDEGGRGLFLVAQFADRWGTRYTKDGKVIWTEQSLSGSF
ncbi:SpoIIE family protein phosphatase [Streptomyces sp. HNM0575]|uniref:SpoIIE family protein phosphatase/ATP-binding protein n=1 Tax=Streptomyces sp. HNM0575 TaxID=2716338 RepID=UPI00145D36E1|nr:SpoIIE family protein phosphatase/ATP-binding protein [Streptomyces sp. HNM0575]NLU75963.1 SpoIIE family protein phosphatase [Streptomyces sp. HNM0575]